MSNELDTGKNFSAPHPGPPERVPSPFDSLPESIKGRFATLRDHTPAPPPPPIEQAITAILQYVGEDPTRGGLWDTPARVAAAWAHWTRGYAIDVPSLFKDFEDGAEKYREMVVVRDIPFYSHCEHHMAPFFGTASVGYIPDGRVVGLSKLARVVDAFAARLQVQERLTVEIADAIYTNLQCHGVGVVLNARHMCMESRGVAKQGHSTTTSKYYGDMAERDMRNEFLQSIR